MKSDQMGTGHTNPSPRELPLSNQARFRLVSQTGRNVGHIDLAACTERGIVVSAGGASSPNATAELAWGLILAALRQIPQEAERLKAGLWLGSLGRGVAGKTLGVYAFG